MIWRDYEFKDLWMKAELVRQNSWHDSVRERIALMERIDSPKFLIEEEKKKLSTSLLQYELITKEAEKQEEKERIEYLRAHPETPEDMEEIYKQFYLYLNDNKECIASVDFLHEFVEPWYVDEWTPYARTKYHTLELNGARYGKYSSVFDSCFRILLKKLGIR